MGPLEGITKLALGIKLVSCKSDDPEFDWDSVKANLIGTNAAGAGESLDNGAPDADEADDADDADEADDADPVDFFSLSFIKAFNFESDIFNNNQRDYY